MKMLITAAIIAIASFYAGRYFRKHKIGMKDKSEEKELPVIDAEIIREETREKTTSESR